MAKLKGPKPAPVASFDALNDSELVLLANKNGLNVSRATPRDLVVQALETFTPRPEPLPMAGTAETLSKWLQRWWDKLRMQVPKKVCPNCTMCGDLQVMDCYSRNEQAINPLGK